MVSKTRTMEAVTRTAGPLTDIQDAQGPPAKGTGQPVGNWAAATFVWGTWALMLLAGLAYVGRFNFNIPHMDDFAEVPYLTGTETVTAAWLWSQHCEHRNPLQKLILLALAKLSGCDFRAGIFFNVLALGGLAFAMIVAAKRLRGRVAYSDAFFPLALLHWGQGEVLTLSHAADIVVAAVVSGILLVIIARTHVPSTPARALLAGVSLILLPLCGGMGLARVPLLALWLGCWGLLEWRFPAPHRKRYGILLLGLAAVALVLFGLYFIGYQPEPNHPPSPGWRAALKTSIQSLSMGFGAAAVSFWPFSGLGVLGLLLASVGVLAVIWRNQPQDRLRALGLFLFLGGAGLLALGVGWGRSGFGPDAGLSPRYAPWAVLALCCVYYIWGTCSSPAVSSFGQMCLFTLMASTVALNTRYGYDSGNYNRGSMMAFEQDLQSGVPLSMLVKRHSPFFYPSQDVLLEHFRRLRDVGFGKFRHLKDDPALEEVPLPAEPIEVEQVRWEKGTAHATGDAPCLTFALPEPRLIWGIRITYTHSNGENTSPSFELLWKKDEQDSFSEKQRYANSYMGTGPKDQVVTILMGETVGQFRIRPDNKPCVFKISKIVLLLPAADSGSDMASSR